MNVRRMLNELRTSKAAVECFSRLPRLTKRRIYLALVWTLIGLFLAVYKPIYYFYYSNVHAYNVSIYETLSTNRGPRLFLKLPFEASDEPSRVFNSDSHLSKMRLRSEHKCACRRDEMVELAKMARNASSSYYHVTVLGDRERVLKSYELGGEEFERSILTCSLFDSLRRGPYQRVISYSLYGSLDYFYKNLEMLASRVKDEYPGWMMRVYYDEKTTDPSVICQLECARSQEAGLLDNVDLCNVDRIPYDLESTWSAEFMHGMSWRWLAVGDSFVDVLMSRDADSQLTRREIDSANVWLQSNSLFHVMRDNKAHHAPMMGGLWGFAPKLNRPVARKIFNSLTNPTIARAYNPGNDDHRGHDQSFLRDFVWPFARANSVSHDAYWCTTFAGSRPFPSKRSNPRCFTGISIPCDESLELEGREFKDTICPIQCRPQAHIDWIYC